VHHALLVAGEVVGHVTRFGHLEQGLPDARDVAVAEDAEHAGDQALFDAVALAVLVGQERHQRLGHGQPGHGFSSVVVSGRRGSISWPSQVPRIQACAGSSQIRQARSSSGPPMTLR
jgi:hypothetical protein